MGPCLCQLIHNFWDDQKTVARHSGHCGPVFEADSGATQGGLLSPELFNIQIDAVIHHWPLLVTDDDSISADGPGLTVAERLAIFCADDSLVSSTNSTWLQHALGILVGLF